MSFEKNVAKAEINKAALMPSVLTALIIDAIIVSFSILYFGADFEFYIIEVAIVCVLVLLIAAGSKMFILKHTTLALTEKRIYGKAGIINTKSMDSPINKINSISVEQGFWGKVFHYSTVSVSTSSGNYKFAYIENADSFKEKTMEQIEAYENEKLRNQAAMLADSLS